MRFARVLLAPIFTKPSNRKCWPHAESARKKPTGAWKRRFHWDAPTQKPRRRAESKTKRDHKGTRDMAEFETVIKGGTIVDGTLVPPYKADVGIKNGKIVKIGRLPSSDGKQVLDASGLIVAPGVIDLHCHY